MKRSAGDHYSSTLSTSSKYQVI